MENHEDMGRLNPIKLGVELLLTPQPSSLQPWLHPITVHSSTSQYVWYLAPAAIPALLLFFFFFFLLFAISWAAPAAYGGFQARGRIRATAASLCHSNLGSEPRLQPT